MDDLPLLRRLRPSWGWSVGLVVLNLCAAPWIVAPATAKSIGALAGAGRLSGTAGLGPFSDYDRGLAILFVVLALAEMYFLLQLARPRWLQALMRDLAMIPNSRELRRDILFPSGLLSQVTAVLLSLAAVVLIPLIGHGTFVLGSAIFLLAAYLPFIYISHRVRVTGWCPSEVAYQTPGEVLWIGSGFLLTASFVNPWIAYVAAGCLFCLLMLRALLRRHLDREPEPTPKLRW